MPTTYAHDLFGKEVYKRLPKECKAVIRQARSLYLIGLHGPDILFYYKPYCKNPISDVGYHMHKEIAAPFFQRMAQQYRENPDDALAAYLMGFVCHFILDSTCHPYVNTFEADTGVSHAAIEIELDRYLKIKNDKDPFTYDPLSGLCITPRGNRVIASVFQGLESEDIRRALRGMQFYIRLLITRNGLKRGILLTLLRLLGCYHSLEGQVLRKHVIPACEESNEKLASLFEGAISEAADAVENLWNVMRGREELSSRFQRNFDS
ncbi:MAG: zinc dependent phospholipase C family protein [Lachnospiraceae bacterium]|jgi:hypothetical protein